MLAVAELTEELTDVLEAAGIEDADEIASEAAEHGVDADRLTDLAGLLPDERRRPGLALFARTVAARATVSMVLAAGARISALVDIARTYADLDRAALRDNIDVVAGIEATYA